MEPRKERGKNMQYTDIGIDLGTASILVYIRGKGVVLKEPSVVAFDRDTNKIKAIGEDARLMLGRTPGNIVAVRPLRQGVISDYTAAVGFVVNCTATNRYDTVAIENVSLFVYSLSAEDFYQRFLVFHFIYLPFCSS